METPYQKLAIAQLHKDIAECTKAMKEVATLLREQKDLVVPEDPAPVAIANLDELAGMLLSVLVAASEETKSE